MRTTTKLVLVAALVAAGIVLVAGASSGPTVGAATPGVSYAATDQVIVKMRPGGPLDTASLGRAAGRTVTKVRTLGRDTVVLRLPSAQSDAALRATVNAFARVRGVEWVEPDVWMTTLASDPLYGQQWNLGPAGPVVHGIDVANAWNALPPAPARVNVAVVDTGYVDHADLTAVMLPGYDFIGDTRIANDGNGRDGDAHDPGDWITNLESRSGFFRGCPASNSSWHGSHVAGTIAAATDNGQGIAGINPDARIVPVRVLGKCGGYTSDITDGVRWAAGLPVAGVPANANPAKVVNLSLGGSGTCSSTWQSAIDAATTAGTTVVVAAGNANANAANYSPASCARVLTVASTGKAGSRAYYSNYGSTVEIAAPGGDRNADGGDTILSTLNTGTTSPVPSPSGDTYVKYQGTSMASPHVAGVASLLLSADPSLTPAAIGQVLAQTATPFPPGSSCNTSLCGAGIVNAAAAVAAVSGPPPTTTTLPPTTTTLPPTTTTLPPTTTTLPPTTTTLPPTTTTLPPTTTQPPAEAPAPFAKLDPADGTTRVKKHVTLSWETSAGATEYWVCLELDATPEGTCSSFAYGPYTDTSVRFMGLGSRSTYEWQVRADNPNGSTIAGGSAWSFRTR